MALSVGSNVGPYEIVSPIGAGGMGEVYRARDAALGRDVAVKILPAAFSEDPDRLRRFKQEAQAAAALNHPNILTIYHIGEHNGAPYIASELLEGESLRQRLQSGPLPVRKVTDFGIQIARGLAAAHDKGIIHRDLKPENIFVTKDGRAKILDFGLAKLTRPEQDGSGPDSQTLTGRSEPGFVLGTVGYMSPEQVRGQVAGAASDLFSFGAVLYECLAGRRAFRGDTAADTMSAILKEDPPETTQINQQVSPALERIIRHCLEKNPEERFQSARDVAFNLEALSSPPSSITSSIAPATREKSKRMIYAAMGVCLAAALAVGGFVFGSRHRPTSPNYHRLTFRQGTIQNARFAPDGQTIVYSASFDGDPPELFTTHSQGPESRVLGLKGDTLLSVSKSGELAVMVGAHALEATFYRGTLARLPMEGGAPREVESNVQHAEWSPDGSAMLIVHQVGGIDQLEFPSGKTISQAGAIGYPRFSPGGERIAFFSYPSHWNLEGSVEVVDLQGHKSVLSTGWTDLTGLAWTPDGKEIWFTGDQDNGSAGLFAVSLDGHQRLIEKIPGDLLLYDIAPDGRVLLGREDWRGGVYGLGPGAVKERDLSWFDFSFAEDISPDGQYVLFGEEGYAAGGVISYLRKMDGSPAVRLSDGDCGSLSLDAERVICTGADTQLYEVPTRTGEVKTLTHDQLMHFSGAWLHGGKQFLFAGQERNHGQRIYVQEAGAGAPRAITPDDVRNYYTVSRDGSRVAVAMGADYRTFIVPISGGEPKPLAGLEPGCLPVTWSSDDRFLYCYRMGDLPLNIVQVEIATGRSTPWKQLMTPDPVGITYLAHVNFSSDMKSYVYDFQRKLDELYVVDGLR